MAVNRPLAGSRRAERTIHPLQAAGSSGGQGFRPDKWTIHPSRAGQFRTREKIGGQWAIGGRRIAHPRGHLGRVGSWRPRIAHRRGHLGRVGSWRPRIAQPRGGPERVGSWRRRDRQRNRKRSRNRPRFPVHASATGTATATAPGGWRPASSQPALRCGSQARLPSPCGRPGGACAEWNGSSRPRVDRVQPRHSGPRAGRRWRYD